jgi:hypothetical protein
VDSDVDMPIVDNSITDIQLNATILDKATKGNPENTVEWKTFFDFVENKEELYPPFGVRVKNAFDPIF